MPLIFTPKLLSVDIIAPNLVVDNLTHPTPGLAILTARGYQQEHLTAIPNEGFPDFTCDADWFYGGAQYSDRCDFDNDFCAEFENQTYVIYSTNVTFIFKNISENASFSSNLIPVPQSILEAMKNSSGIDNLMVLIEGNVSFIYTINDRGFDGVDCTSSYYNITGHVPLSVNKSFAVAGTKKLFFLRSPVLREQWFRSNRFNTIVLSQSPLYYAEISKDGNQTWNSTLREFYNVTDNYTVMYVFSNKTSEKGWSEAVNLTTPTLLQDTNHSFAYIYEFNYSYLGLGKHALSLDVNDSFLGSAHYGEVLLSRMLSYNGTFSEQGKPIDEEITRKSAGFTKQGLGFVELALGFVALILFLSFLNFWVTR